jgi:hypothetical protein
MAEELDNIFKDIDEITKNFKEQEKQGQRDILRYYDRIHDKLFSFNNMLIAGYFVIIAMPNSTMSPWWMILPIINMLHLVFVDYEMMEKSRFDSNIMNKSEKEIYQYGKRISKTTLRSLFTIISTLITTIIFLIQLINFV